MGNGHATGAARAIRTLWGSGAVGTLTDAQLIARFVERRDESAEIAFEALVARHGPMVLRVARDVLRDPHSTQDAFQATFLVLARKAGSISRPETLGPWLHGVASRVARKARVEAGRRLRHERRAAERAATTVEPEADRVDPGLGPTLHEEVARLPAPCRVAVVLCYFEGLSYDQAARCLGVTEATIRGRLARARRALRGRLAARGATAWSLPAVPHRWICPTARAASRFAKGSKDAAPASVAGLAEGVLRTMFFSKLNAAAVLLAFHIAAIAAVMARPQPQEAADGPEPPAVKEPARPRSEVPEMIRRPEEPDKPDHPTLNLDEAISRMLREDADLRSKFYEIPQSKAEILTAPLRANPIFYTDAQLVPGSRYVRSRPGGQTRYDVNVSFPVSPNTLKWPVAPPPFDTNFAFPTDPFAPIRPASHAQNDVNVAYPLDVSRKRAAWKALRPTKVTEAEYVDAARLRIDALASAFAEALVARDQLKLRLEGVERFDRLTEVAREKDEGPEGLRRIEEARGASKSERDRAAARFDRARHALSPLLKLSETDAAGLEVIGELDLMSYVPRLETLTSDALASRPDLIAYRLGVERAKADVKLQHANRLQDSPLEAILKNRDDQPAELNLAQPQGGLAIVERQVISDVRRASRECADSLQPIFVAMEKATAARYTLDTAWSRYPNGAQDLAGLLAASEQADGATRRRIDVLARHYRARITLNTAVGRRVVQP
jgi:RNA polymerase sigma factor (sigma-70 family)